MDYLDLVFAKIFNLQVSHVEYDNKSYYPWSTIWYDRPENIKNDTSRTHDPNHECFGYDEHEWYNDEYNEYKKDENDYITDELEKSKIIIKNEKDIKINFIKDTCTDNWIDSELSKELHDGDDDVYLSRDVTIFNDIGRINQDHRGSNHFALDISSLFRKKVHIPKGTHNFYDLARIAWQIKGNLFDNQYELVIGSKGNTFETKDGFLVNIGIDHGS
jgi:hypothetical protein